jgi:hypothetical protein
VTPVDGRGVSMTSDLAHSAGRVLWTNRLTATESFGTPSAECPKRRHEYVYRHDQRVRSPLIFSEIRCKSAIFGRGRNSRRATVTPEVAGSSPVAPVGSSWLWQTNTAAMLPASSRSAWATSCGPTSGCDARALRHRCSLLQGRLIVAECPTRSNSVDLRHRENQPLSGGESLSAIRRELMPPVAT